MSEKMLLVGSPLQIKIWKLIFGDCVEYVINKPIPEDKK